GGGALPPSRRRTRGHGRIPPGSGRSCLMTLTHHDTEIHADPDVPTIRIIREFDAPPDRVFRAFTDPELFARWIGPRAFTTRIDSWDARTGGSWRYGTMSGDEEVAAFYGSFHEVR